MYVYKHTDTDQNGQWLWTVGYYEPNGEWQSESDHSSEDAARDRVHYLNGGSQPELLEAAIAAVNSDSGNMRTAEGRRPIRLALKQLAQAIAKATGGE